jgi:lysozyme
MRISPEGLAFIKRMEGCSLTAYLDSVKVPTIGVGHTRGVKMGDTCTEEQADQYLLDDLESVYSDIDALVDVPLTQGQFDALCSFVFNLGGPALRSSTLLKLLNAGDYEAARKQIPRWDKAGKQVLAGLTKRRAAEAAMFA